MSFLGIGPLEVLFIALIAVVLVGPRDLRKVAHSAGRTLKRIYRSDTWKALTQMSRSLRDLPGTLVREAEFEEIEEIRRTATDVKKVIKGDLQGVKTDLQELENSLASPTGMDVQAAHTEDASTEKGPAA